MGCDYYIQTDLVIVYYDNNNALSSTKTNKFLEKLGEYSYSFYLLHGLIIAWFIHLLDLPTTLSGKWIYVSGIFICSWMIAAVGYWAIEKKSLLWSKKIKYPYATRITGSK